MATIYGTIESLKALKSELKSNGISRFSSIKEIKAFLSSYNSEKLTILNAESVKLEKEYLETCTNLKQANHRKAEIIKSETEKIDNRISDLQIRISSISKDASFLKRLIFSVHLYFLKKQSNHLINNKTKLISKSLLDINRNIKNNEFFINDYESEKDKLIQERAKSKIQKLDYTRNVLEGLRNLISGAVGENQVVNEIKKLSDDYVLINDFNLSFHRPIFYKKHKQWVSSIQIDHLLISKAGIFIIETKNWSQSSVNSLSLRSPIEQIERANFALYIYVSENITLHDHHWGEQQVPIRNLIVMINNKPKETFKYVKVKLLKEMNNYIKYFEPVLNDNQFNRIVSALINQ